MLSCWAYAENMPAEYLCYDNLHTFIHSKTKWKLSMIKSFPTSQSYWINYSSENFLTSRNFFLTMPSCNPDVLVDQDHATFWLSPTAERPAHIFRLNTSCKFKYMILTSFDRRWCLGSSLGWYSSLGLGVIGPFIKPCTCHPGRYQHTNSIAEAILPRTRFPLHHVMPCVVAL